MTKNMVKNDSCCIGHKSDCQLSAHSRPDHGLLNSIEKDTEVISGDLALPGVCRDPKDDRFIACAVEGGADYLVSGDKDLLDIGEYRGVQIIKPREFAEVLENSIVS